MLQPLNGISIPRDRLLATTHGYNSTRLATATIVTLAESHKGGTVDGSTAEPAAVRNHRSTDCTDDQSGDPRNQPTAAVRSRSEHQRSALSARCTQTEHSVLVQTARRLLDEWEVSRNTYRGHANWGIRACNHRHHRDRTKSSDTVGTWKYRDVTAVAGNILINELDSGDIAPGSADRAGPSGCSRRGRAVVRREAVAAQQGAPVARPRNAARGSLTRSFSPRSSRGIIQRAEDGRAQPGRPFVCRRPFHPTRNGRSVMLARALNRRPTN